MSGNRAKKLEATDVQVIGAYKRTGSVWEAAKLLGASGQAVHYRLKRLGVTMEGNGKPWTQVHDEQLKAEYEAHAMVGSLDVLANKMGRTKYFIAKKARALGLTDQSRERRYAAKWKYMRENDAREWLEKFKKSKLSVRQFTIRNKLSVIWHLKMIELLPGEWEAAVESAKPKSSKYTLGRAVEYAAMKQLRSRGYFCLRAPASKGAADVVALKKGRVLILNSKRDITMCQPADWNRSFELAESVGAIPLVCGRVPGFRGIKFMRMKSIKTGKREPQPWEEFEP